MQKSKNNSRIILVIILTVLIILSFAVLAVPHTHTEKLFDSLPAENVTDARSKDGYELKQMLIVSRHNIRSPLSGGDSLLSQITPHEWFAWTSESGELSVKGGQLETAMGQFFRKYLESREFIPSNWIPGDGEVRFYSNSMQRTIATARFFSTGMLPVANVEIEYHKEYGEVDPIFCPIIRCNSPEFEAQVRRELDTMGGEEGIAGISKSLEGSYKLLEKVLDFKNSKYAKENGIEHIPTDDFSIKFVEGEEISMSGGLKIANSAVDALKLQIYEEENLDKALFGHDLTTEQIQDICKIGDAYQEICEGSKTFSTQVMAPMLTEMKKELETAGRKFTFLCGHDSTITAITAALDISEYLLPGAISQKAPIGGKLVFEKYKGNDGQEYMKLWMAYASADQLRNNTIISMEDAPMFYELAFEGISKNADGYYRYEDVVSRFDEAILLGNEFIDENVLEEAA